MTARVNINIPVELFRQVNILVEKGYFSNFSEIVREGLREEVRRYQDKLSLLSDDEKKLFALLKEADQRGQLLDEKEMKRHGLSI